MTKKKIILSVIVVILIVLIAFCLIYTRPRTLDSILNGKEITNLSAHISVKDIKMGKPTIDSWSIQGDLVDDEILSDLKALMRSCKYRTKLISLTKPTSVSGDNSAYSAYLHVILDDGSDFNIDYMGSIVTFDFPNGCITSATDKQIAAKLSEYIIPISETNE